MEQIRKVNAYVAPGLLRSNVSQQTASIIIQTHGAEWFLDRIIVAVLLATKLTLRDITSKKRDRPLVIARHLIRFYGWELLRSSMALAQIEFRMTMGRKLDHSNVIRSKDLVKEALVLNDAMSSEIKRLIGIIDYELNKIPLNESNSTNG